MQLKIMIIYYNKRVNITVDKKCISMLLCRGGVKNEEKNKSVFDYFSLNNFYNYIDNYR